MTQANLQYSSASDMKMLDRFRFGTKTKTLAGPYTILVTDPPAHFLNNGGAARNVFLPPVSDGLIFMVANVAGGAFSLTVRDAGDTLTVVVVAQGKAAMLFCNGVVWQPLHGV